MCTTRAVYRYALPRPPAANAYAALAPLDNRALAPARSSARRVSAAVHRARCSGSGYRSPVRIRVNTHRGGRRRPVPRYVPAAAGAGHGAMHIYMRMHTWPVFQHMHSQNTLPLIMMHENSRGQQQYYRYHMGPIKEEGGSRSGLHTRVDAGACPRTYRARELHVASRVTVPRGRIFLLLFIYLTTMFMWTVHRGRALVRGMGRVGWRLCLPAVRIDRVAHNHRAHPCPSLAIAA